MKYLPRFFAAVALVTSFFVATTGWACTPPFLNGRTLTFTITTGTGVFAKTGSFLFSTAKTGTAYTITPIRGLTPATKGNYFYTPATENTATIDFNDSGVNGFPYNGTFDVIEFTSPSGGNFHRGATSGAEGTQSGTFMLTTSREDLNRDGQTDVLWEDTTGHLTLWQMSGISFSKGVSLDSLYDDNEGRSRDAAWRIVGQEDFDQDGNTDLLWQNRDDGSAKIWYLSKTNFISEETLDFLGVPDATWRIVGMADFDNDCQIDAVLQSTDGHVQIVPNFRQTSFSDGVAMNNGAAINLAWQIVGVNDFNNDGKPDILLRHKAGYVSLWRMDGLTLNRTVNLPTLPLTSAWKIVGLGDFNRDGQMDLLVRHNTGSMGMWFMRGSQFIGAARIQNGVPIDMTWQVVGPK
ncbi:MAG: hypothetical protein JWM68_2686 [Verrucomicrobiales bacterium]|nr:hypothetical protein [Verrucomicrobiales bacterium]